jgi:mannosylglycoprotein endo-beta-mannosidase
LEVQFTEAEVWAAICAMPTNKSPGPDGFTWEFYRHCWPIIKVDIMEALREVWVGRDQGFDGLNEALITLLPKKEGAVDLQDFRPISLVHSFARLLTKVLARRLAPRMPDLVDSNQTAFIRGRCIQDNFLLVKSSAKLLHSRRIPSFMLKVDVAKAFDSISWPFLLEVLRHRGFGPRWLRWIALLLHTASTCVLVNGCGGAAFLHGRGLRQGDPISPLLFVIAMDVLSAMLRTAEQTGVLSDLASIGLRSRVSLYADDVVIFARATAADLQAVWAVLDCFGAVSGLKENPANSFAAPIQCSDEVLATVAP